MNLKYRQSKQSPTKRRKKITNVKIRAKRQRVDVENKKYKFAQTTQLRENKNKKIRETTFFFFFN